jgi:Na+/H+ antiporter NhaD/arsenite permease-like protein
LLVLSGLLSSGDALIGIASGVDVYLFLAGMMLLAEIARHEGFFNWAAAVATVSEGSASRLFLKANAHGCKAEAEGTNPGHIFAYQVHTGWKKHRKT